MFLQLDKYTGMILLMLFVSNTIYGLACPFMPKFFKDRGIESTWMGVIFAAYAAASTISALISGQFLDRIGHSRFILVGALVMSASIVTFGLIVKI